MKATVFHDMKIEELKIKVGELEEIFFRLRCNKTIGQLEDTSALRHARRDVARAKTILNEKLKT